MAFCEDEYNLMIYDGNKINSFALDDNTYIIPDIGLKWPDVPVNYWYSSTMIPKNLYAQFLSNIKYGKLPINDIIPLINIYSYAHHQGKILYLFFDSYTQSIDENEFRCLYNFHKLQVNKDWDSFLYYGKIDEIEYILLYNSTVY